MARKREAEDQEAAKAEKYEQKPTEATNGKKSKTQSRHAAYRQNQDLSQSPGSFLRRLNGSRPQNGSTSKKPRASGKDSKSPGAPPSGNRPINPFRYMYVRMSSISPHFFLMKWRSQQAFQIIR